MRVSLLLRTAPVALIALTGPAFAQTPDDEPPSVETVCDPLHPNHPGGGATPGLFGLCVAYCEAQDCGDNPECQAENPGDAWGAHSCGCVDVLDNYNALRQAGDPSMPCIEESCPCFDAEFLANDISTISVCVDRATPSRDQTLVNGADSAGCSAVAQAFTNFDSQGSPTAVVCQAFDKDRDPTSNLCTTTLNTVQSGLSNAQFQACQDLIRAHCSP